MSVVGGTRSSSTSSSVTAQPSGKRDRPETDSTGLPVSSSRCRCARSAARVPLRPLREPLPDESLAEERLSEGERLPDERLSDERSSTALAIASLPFPGELPRLDQPLQQCFLGPVEYVVADPAGAVALFEVGHLLPDGGGVVVAALGLVEQRLKDPAAARNGARHRECQQLEQTHRSAACARSPPCRGSKSSFAKDVPPG